MNLSSGLLFRNTVYNLLGQGLPVIGALICIPFLIRGLGTDRFGVLSIAWIVIGYFSLFDFGIGRALTKVVAEKSGVDGNQEISVIIWTSMLLLVVAGLVGTLVVGGLAHSLVYSLLKVPETLRTESVYAFYLLALSIPCVISTAAIRGVLEAQQQFGPVNAVRIPMGFFTYLGPLLVLQFSKSLFFIVAALLIGRVIAWIVHLLLCIRIMPSLRVNRSLQWSAIKPLLSLGSWMTVSNVVGPLMVTLDRFLIGALISTAAVAYYATPYEMVTKLWLIPGAFVGVLFPAFATTFVRERGRTGLLFKRGVKYIFLCVFPITLVIVAYANEGLTHWLGAGFAQHSARVLQWLALGVFINSLSLVPFALVQGAGRPDLTAKLHLVELPFYLFGVWWLTTSYGIEGTAVAWVLRAAADMVVLFLMAGRMLSIRIITIKATVTAILLVLLIFAFATLSLSANEKIVLFVAMQLGFALISWLLILSPRERAVAWNRINIARLI